MSITDNVKEVRRRIEAAARSVGRDPSEIKLIGVTKTVSAEKVLEMKDAGVADAGENRVQELLRKHDALAGAGINWHMIGHLQTNKVKYIIDKVALIHSVDSVRLAEEINARASAVNRVVDVLLEVNIAGELSKFGILPDNLEINVKNIGELPNINIRGLMCIAPYVENPQENRVFFHTMRKLVVDINGKMYHNRKMDTLSMGMTQDYQAAVMEGATMIRVGTGIFGLRS